MIPTRQRPEATQVYRYAIGSQLPTVVEAFVRLTIEQEVLDGEDFDLDTVSYHDTSFIRSVHVPSPEQFEPFFLSGRAQLIRTQIDENTDRVWLIGTGTPGREERHLEEYDVDTSDPEVDDAAHKELMTVGGVKDDWVFIFTEVDWDEFAAAEVLADEMDPAVAGALMEYFKIREDELPSALLATPSLGSDERRAIAEAVRRSKGAHLGYGPQF